MVYSLGNCGSIHILPCILQEPCPAGTFTNVSATPDVGSCITCPEGYYCPQASATPTDCPQGYYCQQGVGKAEPCPTGTYGNTTREYGLHLPLLLTHPAPLPTGTFRSTTCEYGLHRLLLLTDPAPLALLVTSLMNMGYIVHFC